MALTLGTSSAASFRNMHYLSQTKSLMDKSLQRISSGKRILSSGDDPGGLAFSMRLQNELSMNNAVKSSVENAKSFVEMQDSALKTAGDILVEMQALKNSYDTAALGDSNKAIYAGQFKELQAQLGNLRLEKFSGTSLFSSQSSSSTRIYTSSQGASGSFVSIGNLNFAAAVSSFAAASTTAAVSISADFSGANISLSEALTNIGSLRAQSGGKASVLGFTTDYLETKSVSLEAANSRIMDADIAEETLNYSKYSLQYQAGAAALAQSNLSMEVVLDLLKFPSIRS